MKLLSYYLLLGLLLPLSSRGQTTTGSGTAVLVEGHVLEATSRQPVPFASVSVLHSAVGTVSNAAGVFKLLVPGGRATDSLVVGSIGYASYRAPLKATVPGAPLLLLLQPQQVSLQSVAVTGYTPQTLLKKALRATHAHWLSPALFQTYYRDVPDLLPRCSRPTTASLCASTATILNSPMAWSITAW
ncbi:MAG: carboxypeptidase-like regulatory domain-containing protein [Janthinobacterium lividum]